MIVYGILDFIPLYILAMCIPGTIEVKNGSFGWNDDQPAILKK